MPKDIVIAALAATALSMISQRGASAAENCRIHIETGKCIFVTAGQRVFPDYAVGDEFPIYDHNMIIDVDRYKLPPVNGAWRYYRSGVDIYKVDAGSHLVLDILSGAGR